MLIGLAAVVSLFTVLWLASLALRNSSIVDMWWGPGILLIGLTYRLTTHGAPIRSTLVVAALARKRLGGYTGDTLGAAQQAAEIGALLALTTI